MQVLQCDVFRALSSLSERTAPPEAEPLFELVQEVLLKLEVELIRVRRIGPGRFVARWHRRREVLSEETIFQLVERRPSWWGFLRPQR